MPANDIDAADNPGVRRCLSALETLHARFLTPKTVVPDQKPDNLAGLALAERRRIQQELAQRAETSDFDPLALSALQEALRTTVRPGASGFEVSLEEIGHAIGKIDYLVLWRNFFLHYLGNIYEWQLGAASDDATAEENESKMAVLRSAVAPVVADAMIDRLRQERKQDVNTAVKCMKQEMES